VIGHVGRLAPEKNQEFLLSVARHIADRRPEVRFVLAGGGPLDQDLKEQARRLGLCRHVVFTGPSEYVPELLTAVFDAFVLPSRREGFPCAALEAQAAGLPAVLSDCTPPEAVVLPEIVERRAIEEGESAWADALGRALTRGRWDRQEACRRLTGRGLDVAGSFRRLTRAYDEALAERVRPNDTPLKWPE
jgi:glycosyltransferase involved in cell wall biosynthesis